MKVIKNIIFVAIVFLISIVLLVVGNGYDMYKDAISKIPLTEKVETIKEKENYTKIEEVPEIYIKAVISEEHEHLHHLYTNKEEYQENYWQPYNKLKKLLKLRLHQG